MKRDKISRQRFGAGLRSRREELSLTQEELSAMLEVDVRSVQRWEQGISMPRPKQRRKLLSALTLSPNSADNDLSIAESDDSPSSIAPSSCLETLSLAEILRRGGDADLVLGQIDEIIDEWPSPGGPENFMGTSEKWREVALASPTTHYYVFENVSTVVGFWGFVPVVAEVYSDALQGKNVNSSFRPDDISPLLPGDRVSVYFIDLFRRQRIGSLPFLAQCLTSMRLLLEEWARYDVLLERIVANLSTPEVINLAVRKLGFGFRTEHNCHTMFDRKGRVTATQIHELDIVRSVEQNSWVRQFVTKAGVLDDYMHLS